MIYNIKWENKYSHETGLVGRVMYKAGHFVNATEQIPAKKYKTQNDAEKDIVRLREIGEADNNNLYIVEAE